jgi:hypothetical protein
MRFEELVEEMEAGWGIGWPQVEAAGRFLREHFLPLNVGLGVEVHPWTDQDLYFPRPEAKYRWHVSPPLSEEGIKWPDGIESGKNLYPSGYGIVVTVVGPSWAPTTWTKD